MYMLQYSIDEEGFPETESLETLQAALVRAQQLINISELSSFYAVIIFDNQDDDGNLYEVADY